MTEPMSPPIRVALVDDQQLVRAGFAMVIGSQPDMEVVLEAGDGAQAVRLIPSYGVDVVLMDVRMPQLDGIAATRALLEASASAPRIVMLTTFDLDEYVLAAIRAGASGFLLKDTQPEDMLTAIRTVHVGDGVIAPSATRRLIEHVASTTPTQARTAAPEVLAGLTAREMEVLGLIARGRSNLEIAADLVVAEATVKTHVGRLLAKLEVRDRVQLVVFAYESGLVAPGAP